MKQHITPKQCAKIAEEQVCKLLGEDIGKPKDYTHVHHKKFTIGKMIEILISYKPNIIFERLCDYYSEEYMWDTDHTYREELADALWEEIKLLI